MKTEPPVYRAPSTVKQEMLEELKEPTKFVARPKQPSPQAFVQINAPTKGENGGDCPPVKITYY